MSKFELTVTEEKCETKYLLEMSWKCKKEDQWVDYVVILYKLIGSKPFLIRGTLAGLKNN